MKKSIVIPCRVAFFVLFVVCNAIICATSVWNLGIAQSIHRGVEVDTYLTATSALGLLSFFVLGMIELTRRDAVTTRVWFECSWVGLFYVLELAGAIALSTNGPSSMCDPLVVPTILGACKSTQVLLAFTWLCTLFLLTYLMVLTISAFVHQHDDPTVWDAHVRRYRWRGTESKLGNESTASLRQFIAKSNSIKAPQPRRPAPNALYAHRKTLSSEYDVENQRPVPPVPAARAPEHMRQAVRDNSAPSLYPKHMQSFAPAQTLTRQVKPLPESPPPLGSWPRANIVNEPVRSKRKAPPPVNPPNLSQTQHRVSASTSAPSSYLPPSSRPAGPRTTTHTRSKSSGDWKNRVVVPPPLDLSKISNNRATEF